MSLLALEPRLFDPPSAEPTLDQRLVGVWDGLIDCRVVDCPVCGGEMEPAYAGRRPAGGRCRACGSTLA